jgi:hypothetical protein
MKPDPIPCVRALCAIASAEPPRLVWRFVQFSIIAALWMTRAVLRVRG